MCPLIEPLRGNWMAYKDFKDAVFRIFEKRKWVLVCLVLHAKDAY